MCRLREMIDRYIDALGSLRDRIEGEQLVEDFDYANEVRGQIPKDSKGFLHPLFEAFLIVEDKPGVLAKLRTCSSSSMPKRTTS